MPGSGSVTAVASAKINLALRVGARRRDGYHALATLFQAVSLEDEVTLTFGGTGLQLELDGSETVNVPAGPTNLALAALRLLAERTGQDVADRGVQMRLVKRIPVAAGLAGGSADAAAALVAGDALWRTRLPRSELLGMAATLGADVPFSFTGGTAVGTGRGDVLAPALARGTFDWVLAVSDSQLSTPAVFAELDRMRGPAGPGGPAVSPQQRGPVMVARAPVRQSAAGPQGPRGPVGPAGAAGPGVAVRPMPPPVDPVLPASVLAAVRTGDPEALAAALHNDLQRAAVALRPQLARCLQAGADLGALGSVVCGSGPTCAFLVADHDDALTLAAGLTAMDVTRTALVVSGPAPGARLVPRQ